MAKNCEMVLRSGIWAGGTCGKELLPGFDTCWRHASIEAMAIKIVDLTGQSGAIQRDRDEAVADVDRLRVAWLDEQHRRHDAETVLSDLQRSIASALFGAARDDDRVPPEKISGHMIDALNQHLSGHLIPREALTECAEAFLDEESRRGE